MLYRQKSKLLAVRSGAYSLRLVFAYILESVYNFVDAYIFVGAYIFFGAYIFGFPRSDSAGIYS